jgi:hypothetical protein
VSSKAFSDAQIVAIVEYNRSLKPEKGSASRIDRVVHSLDKASGRR